MDEQHWLALTDLNELIRCTPFMTRRKWLLFAYACTRRIEDFLIFRDSPTLPNPSRLVLLADEPGNSTAEYRAGLQGILEVGLSLARAADARTGGNYAGTFTPHSNYTSAVTRLVTAARLIITAYRGRGMKAARLKERRMQRLLFRDIVGNPFRARQVDPAWLAANDRAAWHLARAIGQEAHFGRLRILADALEDAGCWDADILGHCRGRGPHVRGCWVVELMLGCVPQTSVRPSPAP